jgi:DNA replication protein DnaC
MPQLTPHLKQLRLSGILDSLEIRNRQAVEQKLAYVDFLALLIEDEIARRELRKLVMRQRRAGINTQKTLESYDFAFNLGVNQAQIMDLATCRYLEEKVPVLIVGPCGTGKSHLAQALGHIAVRPATTPCSPLTQGCWANSPQRGPWATSSASWRH